MALTTTSTLPEGMKERSFAFVNSENEETVIFGRGSDFPCSTYTFPALNIEGDDYPVRGHHTSIIGNRQMTPDYFEAEFGATEPNSTAKMERIISAWSRANYLRPAIGAHYLYHILGGRPRMMYGVPKSIAPTYNGFKSAFQNGILRFQPIDPFYYSAEKYSELRMFPTTAESTTTFQIPIVTQMPTPVSLSVIGSINGLLDIQIGPSEQGPWRTLTALNTLNGTLNVVNSPGIAYSRFISTDQVVGSGADFINPRTPSYRDIKFWPSDRYIKVIKPAASIFNISWNWRACYASA